MKELETELKRLMVLKSGSVRAFAIDNEIPYTTLRSMLNRGVMSTNVSNVIAICKALNIKPESLEEEKLRFWDEQHIVHGSNNGLNGQNHGSVTINNGTSKENFDRSHDQQMADFELQKEILSYLGKQTEILNQLLLNTEKILDKLDK